jgi:hypothetical protein
MHECQLTSSLMDLFREGSRIFYAHAHQGGCCAAYGVRTLLPDNRISTHEAGRTKKEKKKKIIGAVYKVTRLNTGRWIPQDIEYS